MKSTGVEVVQTLNVVSPGLLVLEPTTCSPCLYSLWSLIFSSNTAYSYLVTIDSRLTRQKRRRHPQDLIVNICWMMDFRRRMCFIFYSKAFDCMDLEKLWVALEEMGMSQHFIFPDV